MAELQLCIIQDFLTKASIYALPRLDENIAYQSEDALDHYKKVKEEVHQKISSINLIAPFHIFLQLVFCLSLEELHNVSHSISNFCAHVFSFQFPSLQELYRRFRLLYLALKYMQYQSDSLNLIIIAPPNELPIFLFLSMGYQPNLKTYLSYSRLIIHVVQILLLYFLIQFEFLFPSCNQNHRNC